MRQVKLFFITELGERGTELKAVLARSLESLRRQNQFEIELLTIDGVSISSVTGGVYSDSCRKLT